MSQPMPDSHWHLPRGPWTDEPRYYPPGQHPATARMREDLARAEQLKAETRRKSVEHGTEYDTAQLDEFIAYMREQLANFEAGESEAKARAAARFRQDRPDAR